MIYSYEEELCNKDLLELNLNQYYDNVQQQESEKPNEKVLTIKWLSKAFFNWLKKTIKCIVNYEDSNHGRFLQVERNVLNSSTWVSKICIMMRKMQPSSEH